jgi:hypothetical protein
MKRASFALLVAGLSLVSHAARARGQSPWSAGLAVGRADVTGGKYSNDRHRTVYDGQLGFRVMRLFGADIIAGASAAGFVGHSTVAIAYPCPSTGCDFASQPPGVPNFDYEAATLAAHLPLGRVTLALDGGVGSVGVRGAGRRLGVSRGVGLVFGLGAGLSATMHAGVLSWTEQGNTLYAYPVLVGVRIN